MMTFEINHAERFSRGELLLRTFFGWLYIAIPHGFLLMFVGLAAAILHFLSFWVILFTGRYPESWFEFQVKQMRWNVRVSARLLNLADGYPKFGLNAQDEETTFDVTYPENISRGSVLMRFLFGWIYILIPHGIILNVLIIGLLFVNFIGFWAVLFTGKYPKSMFDFQVYVLRWSQRVTAYWYFMTQTYPPFSGEPDQQLQGDGSGVLDDEV